MKCPVCGKKLTMVKTEDTLQPGKMIEVPKDLYQVSYLGTKEYRVRRCADCYAKLVKEQT